MPRHHIIATSRRRVVFEPVRACFDTAPADQATPEQSRPIRQQMVGSRTSAGVHQTVTVHRAAPVSGFRSAHRTVTVRGGRRRGMRVTALTFRSSWLPASFAAATIRSRKLGEDTWSYRPVLNSGYSERPWRPVSRRRVHRAQTHLETGIRVAGAVALIGFDDRS